MAKFINSKLRWVSSSLIPPVVFYTMPFTLILIFLHKPSTLLPPVLTPAAPSRREGSLILVRPLLKQCECTIPNLLITCTEMQMCCPLPTALPLQPVLFFIILTSICLLCIYLLSCYHFRLQFKLPECRNFISLILLSTEVDACFFVGSQ